jgi:hypothetical protein
MAARQETRPFLSVPLSSRRGVPAAVRPRPEALHAGLTRRVIADRQPGFRCQVCLAEAAPGKPRILFHYVQHDVTTPFRAAHAGYVREGAEQCRTEVGGVPPLLRARAVAAWMRRRRMGVADVKDGTALERAMEAMFGDPAVAFIHLHFCRPGCPAAAVVRA